jgi:hypothetical protein
MKREYENGYPTQRMIYKLADVLGVNRHALAFSDAYGVGKSVIYYKSEIANRSIETFAKFLMYNRVEVETYNDGKIIINQSKQ